MVVVCGYLGLEKAEVHVHLKQGKYNGPFSGAHVKRTSDGFILHKWGTLLPNGNQEGDAFNLKDLKKIMDHGCKGWTTLKFWKKSIKTCP